MTGPSWTMVPLGEVLRLDEDRVEVTLGESYPQVGIRGFGGGLFAKAAVAAEETTYRYFNRLYAGAYVVSQVKGWEGAVAVCGPESEGAFVSPEYRTFRCDPDRLKPAYLAYLCRTSWLHGHLAKLTRGQGARRERLRPEGLLSLRIPLPSMAEQLRIVARLDAGTELIVAHRRAAAVVGDELDATLASAFSKITAGASRARLGDVAPLVRREVTIDGGVTYQEIGARAFGRGLFRKPDVTGSDLTWQKLFRIEEGDLVFSNIKAWEGAFAVAGPEHHGKMGSHRYLTCVPDPARATAQFLWFCLQSPDGLHQVQAASPGSADRNRTLRTSALARIEIPLPSLDAQRWFGTVSERAHAVRTQTMAAEADLALLLPSLLNSAFSGDAEPDLAIRKPIAAE